MKLPFPIIRLSYAQTKEPIFRDENWIKPAPLREPLIGAVLNRAHRRQFPWLWTAQVRKYVANGKIPNYQALIKAPGEGGKEFPRIPSGHRRGKKG